MQQKTSSPRRARLALWLAAAGLALAAPVQAANHALIMTIGKYADPNENLPGVDIDAANARRIANTLGVPDANIVQLKDSQLTKAGMQQALQAFAQRVQSGDGVFVYYSGHGSQEPNRTGATGKKCIEGMVAHDMKLVQDVELERMLATLSQRAGRVVMMNDSCFAGGQARSKSLGAPVPKRVKGYEGDPNYVCGQPVNVTKATRDLFLAPQRANMLYIAASADNEVAWATDHGSAATLGWLQCTAAADRDNNGVLNGEEIRRCAQAAVDAGRAGRQTITLIGNTQLPLVLTAAAPDAGATGGGAAPVNAAAALEAIRAGASSSIGVTLRPARTEMRIQQDDFEFTVHTDRPGYLYVLQVGSSGKTFNMLFPNELQTDNYVQAGNVALPRAPLRIKAGGPEGTNYLLAVVAEKPRDFSRFMPAKVGPFSTVETSKRATRDLYLVTSGGDSAAPGVYGASAVVAVREVR